ncbi:MAG TPA: flagellar basal body protein, partial [Azospirillum sp.]|nr:flagellar basal body protein [Azospirillum sp.]
MTTAVLGLNAQSRALGHISDNIANASTLGY